MGHNLSLRTRRLLARGISPRSARRWGASVQFLSLGSGGRASKVFGTGNSSYVVYAKSPGTGGNAVTFSVAVAGANTPASVSVAGNAVTFNAATNGASAATSTVRQMREVVDGNPLVHVQSAPASDGTGVVAAAAATALVGGV